MRISWTFDKDGAVFGVCASYRFRVVPAVVGYRLVVHRLVFYSSGRLFRWSLSATNHATVEEAQWAAERIVAN